jgi:hypothetical protein
MRSSHSRLATTIIAGLFVAAACTSTATPTPVATPTPAPSPTTSALSPEASGPAATATPDPSAELFALDCSGGEPCRLAYLPEGGTDEPGWPVIVSGPCRGTAMSDGIAYAACDTPDGVLLHAFDADATPLPGWPVHLPGTTASVYDNLFTIGCGDERSSLRIAGSKAIVVAVAEADAALLYVLRPNGEPLPGWPRPFPGDPPDSDGVGGNGCRGFTVTATDDIVAWGYQGIEPGNVTLIAARTEFTVLGPDGRTHPGWPRGSIGAASRPVVANDGSISYTSATGNVWRHRADGEIVDGWPYQLTVEAPPYLAPDGRLVVLLQGYVDSDRAISLDAGGAATRGWPLSLGGRVETPCRLGDTPCGGNIEPAFAPDGTTYVALSSCWMTSCSEVATDPGGAIVAIEPDGQIATGWPIQLAERTYARHLTVDEKGQLVVRGVVCEQNRCGDGGLTEATLVYSADGSLLYSLHKRVIDW